VDADADQAADLLGELWTAILGVIFIICKPRVCHGSQTGSMATNFRSTRQFMWTILLPRDASQSEVLLKRVACLSVRLFVRSLRYRDHIGWNTSKIISRLVILLFGKIRHTLPELR